MTRQKFDSCLLEKSKFSIGSKMGQELTEKRPKMDQKWTQDGQKMDREWTQK